MSGGNEKLFTTDFTDGQQIFQGTSSVLIREIRGELFPSTFFIFRRQILPHDF